ncbi:hypothetical protein ACV3V0_05875 [Clostridium perfringens]
MEGREYVGDLTHKGIITKDYSWFEYDNTNRRIDEEALSSLEDDFNQDINDTEYPFQAPIIVYWVEGKTKGTIQQGHHRFEVCKRNNREINYIITPHYRHPSRGQEDLHQDWTTSELVESYAKEKIESYILLQKLKESYPKYSFAALTVFINSSVCSNDKLRTREFSIKGDATETYTKAVCRIKKFEEFLVASNRTDKPKEVIKVLIEAMERPDFDWKYFIERTNKNASEASVKDAFKSISTNAKAISLIQFYYNNKSQSNFYF